MTAKRWLSVVLPTGLLLGLALGWMTAGAQTLEQHQIDLSRPVHAVNDGFLFDPSITPPVEIVLRAGMNGAGDADMYAVSDEWHCPEDSAGKYFHFRGALYVCVPGNGFIEVASVEPTFKQHPQGWMPSCPAGTALIRHYPAPDCFWGTKPMRSKPTQGDMECVYTAQATKLPACPKE